MKEIIRDIAGYEGRYQITNTGRVLSLPNGSRKGTRELKQEVSVRTNTTYRRVTLCVNGKTKRHQVHRLVCDAFLPNPENKPFVNHKDNNGEYNYQDNLEWCTHKENMEHSSKQGRQDKVKSAGGKALQRIVGPLMIRKLQILLGDRLVNSVIKPRGKSNCRWVTFRCKHCNNVYHRRADSPIVKRGGICTDCL